MKCRQETSLPLGEAKRYDGSRALRCEAVHVRHVRRRGHSREFLDGLRMDHSRTERSESAISNSATTRKIDRSQLSVYAGELEVRPPGAPITWPVRVVCGLRKMLDEHSSPKEP